MFKIDIRDDELDDLLNTFSYRPTGRLDALDNAERLVAIRRAVTAGFYSEWPRWTCTGCVPCRRPETCRCGCHALVA